MASFSARTTADLMKIAASGGGFVLDAAARTTPDLMQIASAARSTGARLVFRGMNARTTADLMQIGAAGRGQVVFEG